MTTAPTIAAIQRAVCEHYGLALIDMFATRRTTARARQVGYYLARHLTSRSYLEIAHAFGDKNHTSVMHGVDFIGKILREDGSLYPRRRTEKRAISSAIDDVMGKIKILAVENGDNFLYSDYGSGML